MTRLFAPYGEIESVKVMWPRTEEERKRKRNCGFVKFYRYESASRAKEELAEKVVKGMGMRISWGKGISGQIKGLVGEYKGVGGEDMEMLEIEKQLNNVIMGMIIPTDE